MVCFVKKLRVLKLEYGFLSLIPPLSAIFLAIATRRVIVSLFVGVLIGKLVVAGFNPFFAIYLSIEELIALFKEGWVVKSIVFAALIGSLLTLAVESGGVGAFVAYLIERSKRIRSKRAALLMGYMLGIIIFIESTITSLVVGAVTTPLARRFGASNAKVAYICDATSAPVCSLIPLNGWGALMGTLIAGKISQGVIAGEATEFVIRSISYNFYAIAAVLFALWIIISGRDFAGMKRSEEAAHRDMHEHQTNPFEVGGSVWYMGVPLGALFSLVFIYLYLSGDGNLLKGSGTTAVFYATISALAVSYVYYVHVARIFDSERFGRVVASGAASMGSLAVILLLAFALADVTKELHTGVYLAEMMKLSISPVYIAPLVFLTACAISFSTGTSWGTFSIAIPLAIDIAVGMGANVYLLIGAAISGGVFGDHCSPVSDTTIVSSMASKCDHIEHVNTQLPYAIVSALIALAAFFACGFFGW